MEFLASEWRRFFKTIVWSIEGWNATWRTEKTLRYWTLAVAISIATSFVLEIGPVARAMIVALSLLVLAAELMNTAVESAINYISTEIHPLAKKAKDAASAAVAMTAGAAGLAWLILLADLAFG